MSTGSVVIERRVLSNGITVLVQPDTRFNTCAIALYIVSGLTDETPQRAGITHLLEHLLFRKTKRKSNRDISLWIDEVGGDVNAFTDPLSLCLHATVPSHRTFEVVDMFAELLLESAVDQDDLDLECEVIRQEILESEDDPDDIVYQEFNRQYWKNSMLRFPVFGQIDSLQQFTLEQIKVRLAELLHGKRIVIGAVGNVNADEMTHRIEKHFAFLGEGERPRLELGEPQRGSSLIHRADEQIHFILGMPWPVAGSPDQAPAHMFSVLFGAGVSSRLFQLLREERGLVYDCGCEIDGFPGGAVFEVFGVVERANFNQTLELVLGEVHKVRETPISAAELERAKRMVLSQVEMEGDSLGSRLWRAVEGEVFLGRYQSLEESLRKIQAVQPQDVSRVVEQWLKTEPACVSFVGDVEGVLLPQSIAGLLPK